jgi:hypothetical protein
MRPEERIASRSVMVLRNVARCPACGVRVEMPCRECAVKEQRGNGRAAREFVKAVLTNG